MGANFDRFGALTRLTYFFLVRLDRRYQEIFFVGM